jgi:hypothetical protein
MNRISVLFLIPVFTLLLSCKNDPKSANAADVQHASPAILQGHWIAMDFCSRAKQYGSVLAALNNSHAPYAFALSFKEDQPDSVTCYNGFEMWKSGVKFNVDTLEMKEARPGKSIFMVYDPKSKDLTMFDPTNEGSAQMDRFIKSKAESPNGYKAFTTALNHSLFEGYFFPIGKKVEKAVQFSPDGNIADFADYDRYLPCTGGDCFLLGDQMDVITLAVNKDKESKKMFGFKYSANGDTLSFYQLIPSATEKSAQVGKVAYRFLKKMPEPPAKK